VLNITLSVIAVFKCLIGCIMRQDTHFLGLLLNPSKMMRHCSANLTFLENIKSTRFVNVVLWNWPSQKRWHCSLAATYK